MLWWAALQPTKRNSSNIQGDMMTKTQSAIALSIAAGLLSGCASMNQKALKAPCGPTAGLTDPCGNATPINSPADIDAVRNAATL